MNENIRTAIRALESNRLRSILTISIIATGIMSIVGIQTAIAILTETVVGSFEKMGAGMFTMQGKQGEATITLREARQFQTATDTFASAVSAYRYDDMIARATSGGKSTDPVVSLISTDPHYLTCQAGAIAEGRNLLQRDLENNAKVAIIGDNIRRRLFGEGSDCIGKSITCNGRKYIIAGAFKRQGAIFGASLDNSVITPLTDGADVLIDLIPKKGLSLMDAAERSASIFRSIRRLGTLQKPDFEIIKSNTAEDTLNSVSKKLSLVALAIGLITLLGAAVGLMNIMLVSVKQRTREIGLRKAVGARPSTIRNQFLAEAVVIGQAGDVIGIIMGILLGNIVSLIMDGDFTIPWKWVGVAVVLCLCVSILSGIVPAIRAASLDPIEALHNE